MKLLIMIITNKLNNESILLLLLLRNHSYIWKEVTNKIKHEHQNSKELFGVVDFIDK